jgi:hypothetical protein
LAAANIHYTLQTMNCLANAPIIVIQSNDYKISYNAKTIAI